MISLTCRPLPALIAVAALAAAAEAGIPDPTLSTIDGDFMIGNARGLAIVAGLPNVRATCVNGYEVIVRDNSGLPLAGVLVSMHFAGTGIQVHATQSGGQVANCTADYISLVTDASGRANFFPATVGENSFNGSNVLIRAGGMLLAAIRFHSIDLVPVGGGGAGSVSVADLNAFRLRFLSQGGHSSLDPECDYATEGGSTNKIDASDLNLFRTEFLCGTAGGAPAPCAKTECPVAPPAAPSNLTAGALSERAIVLNWKDNASNEESYVVERSSSGPGGPFVPVATLPANSQSYTDSGRGAGKEYCYRVVARNQAGDSNPSNVACARTQGKVTCEWVSQRFGPLAGQAVNPDSASLIAPRICGLEPGQTVYIYIMESDATSGNDTLRTFQATADANGCIQPGTPPNDWAVPPQDLGDPGEYSEPFIAVRDGSGNLISSCPYINVPYRNLVEEEYAWKEVDQTKFNLGADIPSFKLGGIGGAMHVAKSTDVQRIRTGKARSGVLDPHVTLEVLTTSPLPPGWSVDIVPQEFDLAPADSVEDSLVVVAPTDGYVLFVVRTRFSTSAPGGIDSTETDTLALCTPGCSYGGTAEAPPPPAVTIQPNPAGDRGTRISFSAPPGEEVEVAVYDVSGRRLRRSVVRVGEDGGCAYYWDGTDDGGRRVGPGVYFVSASSPRMGRAGTRVVLLK